MIKYLHADKNDYDGIRSFIRDHWSFDHILVHDNDVFDHFFLDGDIPQYFLAKDESKQIIAILGYITNRQFDGNLEYDVAWLSMWMSKKGLKEPVGILLLQFLEKNLKVDFVGSLGVADRVIPLYERMGYIVGKMQHLIKPVPLKQKNQTFTYSISRNLLNENELGSQIFKSELFLEKKYISSKFYAYDEFAINKNDQKITSIVGRTLYDTSLKRRIFRIVDFSGDINGVSIFADNISSELFTEKIDYVDILLSSGSCIREGVFDLACEDNYLPLYFEPLIIEYTKKNFCYKKINYSIDDNILIITGDCDQERPNYR